MIDAEIKVLNRKLKLKRQALQVIRAEMEEIRHRLGLLRLRKSLEGKIPGTFDSAASARLDAVQFLIEDLGRPAHDGLSEDGPIIATPAFLSGRDHGRRTHGEAQNLDRR
jgi:hypothetical protein